MTKIKVRVTAEHIARGKKADYNGCPVALALADAVMAVPTTCGVAGTIDIPGHRDLRAPARVLDWVGDFDSDQPVKPFSFTLEVPE